MAVFWWGKVTKNRDDKEGVREGSVWGFQLTFYHYFITFVL